MILDYNRVVKDLNGYSKEDFLYELSRNFKVEEVGSEAYKPEEKATFGMYLDNTWYKLTLDEELLSDDPVQGLDVAI